MTENTEMADQGTECRMELTVLADNTEMAGAGAESRMELANG